MFRKKTKLPARPKPPEVDQIQEDIVNAPVDDVVFTSLPSLRSVSESNDISIKSNENGNIDSEESSVSEDELDLDALFEKVRNFVEVNTKLNDNVNRFHRGCDQLLESKDQLKSDTVRIRTHINNAFNRQDGDETK